MKHTDVLVIGTGIAALQLAVNLRRDLNVILLTKSQFNQSNSYRAQGGVAGAIGASDHPRIHFEDTMEAGRFLHDEEAVRVLTSEGRDIILELAEGGCPFDRDESGHLLLGHEGAHRVHRIVHGGGDRTGKQLMEFFSGRLTENIQIWEHFFVYELLVDSESNTCYGVKGRHASGNHEVILADHIVIAAGGLGQIYSVTSNSETATGDGYVLAYRAGAELADMEFIQFHPTLLYADGASRGLVSEAVRGEGGILVTKDGDSIMCDVHPMKDLAPRHVVSQTIFEYRQQGVDVFLDISGVRDFEQRFPSISKMCQEYGVDLKEGLIPVAPGSHFSMGGVKTDLDGRTNINRLYAVGEAANTGVHGSNRLASNSLLEGLVFGKRLACWINHHSTGDHSTGDRHLSNGERALRFRDALKYKGSGQQHSTSDRHHRHRNEELRELMMRRVGIVRRKEDLQHQLDWLNQFQIEQLLSADWSTFSNSELTRNFMLVTSWLVTQSALLREESRGGHFRADFPEESEVWGRKHIIHVRRKDKGEVYEQTEAVQTT